MARVAFKAEFSPKDRGKRDAAPVVGRDGETLRKKIQLQSSTTRNEIDCSPAAAAAAAAAAARL